MSWAQIKMAMNSTLGTKDFKPLDKFIMEQKKLVATDDVYLELEDFTLSTEYNGPEVSAYYPQKIKMIGDGSMRIKGNLKPMDTGKTTRSIYIYLNEEEVYYQEWRAKSTKATTFSKDIYYKNGDVISFFTKVSNTVDNVATSITLTDFSINGKVIHNVFELIEE